MFIVNIRVRECILQMELPRNATLETICRFIKTETGRVVSCSNLRIWDDNHQPKSFELEELSPGQEIFHVPGEDDFEHELPAILQGWGVADDSSVLITPECLIQLFAIGYSPRNCKHTMLLLSIRGLFIPAATFFYVLEKEPDVFLPVALSMMLPWYEIDGTDERRQLTKEQLMLLFASLAPSLNDFEMIYFDAPAWRRMSELPTFEHAMYEGYKMVPYRFPTEHECRTHVAGFAWGFMFYHEGPCYDIPESTEWGSPDRSSFTEDVRKKLAADDPLHKAIEKHFRDGGEDNRRLAHAAYLKYE